MTNIGFTGSRHGMNIAQYNGVRSMFGRVYAAHHGDCVGADSDFHDIALDGGHCEIIGHPPVDARLRAFRNCDSLREAKPYLDRNRDIVDECDVLYATPAEMHDPGKGGTWYTINYARSIGKAVVVFYPDGTLGN